MKVPNSYLWLISAIASTLLQENCCCSAFVIGSTSRIAFRAGATTASGTRVYATNTNTNTTIEPTTNPTASFSDESTTVSSSSKDNNSDVTRPLHQNWWPVASLSMLDHDRPNSVTLLNKKLVVFRSLASESEDNDCWTVLDDRCSHRFAPLSEGRLVESSSENEHRASSSSSSSCAACPMNIQCAYHGWEFEGSKGACTKIPQQPLRTEANGRTSKPSQATGVQSYPVRVMAGLIFVWADPDSYEDVGESIPLPVSESLCEFYNDRGPDTVYQRDLPYGYELLGENLLDLAHLPYAHHGVGGLNRFEHGRPLQFRMLSNTEKSREMVLGTDGGDGSAASAVLKPLYEVELSDAASSDPLFLSMKSTRGEDAVPNGATLRVGFYQPTHVRYTRKIPSSGGKPGLQTQVVLYITPTSSTKSRVFLFNIFARDKAKPEEPASDEPPPRRLAATLSASLQKLVLKILLATKFSPLNSHMLSHDIFDGDGIFLAKQGDRMQRGGGTKSSRPKEGSSSSRSSSKNNDHRPLTYKDYQTPSASDALMNAFRRYVTEAAKRTGDPTLVDAVQPTRVAYDTDRFLRSELLDRYESHTKDCKVCTAALEKGRARERALGLVHTALVGASGASFVTALIGWIGSRWLAAAAAATGAAAASSSTTAMLLDCSKGVAKIALGMALATGGFARLVSKFREKVATSNQKFFFVDYVHAERS